MIETDVAVVGAGPAGIAAATRAAEADARVVLIDEHPHPGGQIWRRDHARAAAGAAAQWLARLRASGTTVHSSTCVMDVDGRTLITDTGSVCAHQVVIATGARERFLPFPGWTLPGVTGVGGLQAMVKTGLDLRDRVVVLAGTGPLLIAVGASLLDRGGRVTTIADQAPVARLRPFLGFLMHEPEKLVQGLGYALDLNPGTMRFGTWVAAAHGRNRIEHVTLTDGKRSWRERCDFLAVGYGLVPQTELAALFGCRLAGDAVWVDRDQQTSIPGVFAAGEPTGIGGVDCALVEGQIAGLAAVGRTDERLMAERDAGLRFKQALADAFELRDELRHVVTQDTIVCRCEDVRLGSLDPFEDRRMAKLVTRCGMGPCQGRVCGPGLQFLKGWGPDTIRPPLMPTSVGDLTC